jgi:hypothetical protein
MSLTIPEECPNVGFIGGSFVDLLVDSGGGEDTEVLPLTRIFYCSFIKESANSQNGKVSWLCKWCGKTFTPRHKASITSNLACVEN